MAVFPDRIVLKNSTDTQSVITDAIRSGGSDAITQGEIVLGLESGDTKLYTVDANGEIIVISTSSAAGRMIVSTEEPTVGVGNLPLANGDTWYNPDPEVETIYVYSEGAWLAASSGSPGANELNELTDVTLSTTINTDEVLVYTGTNWTNRPNIVTWPMTTEGDMAYYAGPTENDPAGPQRLPIGLAGQVLTVVDGAPVWSPLGAESIGVGDLQDVDLYSPDKPLLDGSVLVYDEILSTWYPGTTDGTGTVSYVGIEASNGDIVVLGGPVTSAGTFDLALAQQFAFSSGSQTYPAATITINNSGVVTGVQASSSGDLSDVDLSVAPTDNQVLVWDDTDGAWKPGDQTGGSGGGPGTIASIDDIGDVDTTTDPPVNGEVLTWDNNAGLWISSAPTGGAQILSDLTDVSAVSPSEGEVLTWSDATSDWGPSAAGVGTVTSVAATGIFGVNVTGSPITDSGTFTISLSDTGVAAGSYDGANLTVNSQGRITNISNGFGDPLTADGDIMVRISGTSTRLGAGTEGQVLSIDASGLPLWKGITSAAGGTVTSVDVIGGTGLSSSGGPVTDFGSITLDLTNTGVSAGNYSMATITVDVNGRITSASDGDLSVYVLSDLGDVDTVTNPPTNNQVLVWDAANSRWVADDAPGLETVETIIGGTFGSGL